MTAESERLNWLAPGRCNGALRYSWLSNSHLADRSAFSSAWSSRTSVGGRPRRPREWLYLARAHEERPASASQRDSERPNRATAALGLPASNSQRTARAS